MPVHDPSSESFDWETIFESSDRCGETVARTCLFGQRRISQFSYYNMSAHNVYYVKCNVVLNNVIFDLDGDYSPKSAVDIFVKDLGLVNDTARALTFPLPLATTALNMFTSASNAGFGREDDSAVIKIFNGITLPGHKQ